MTSPVFLPIEGLTGCRKTIDVGHVSLHAGVGYVASHSVSVGTGTVASVLLTTASSGSLLHDHYTFEIMASNACTWTFSEAPNASGGTVVKSFNNHREYTTSAATAITHTPTYVSAGSIITQGLIGTSVGGTRIGGFGEQRNEFILAHDTLYLLRVTALNAGTTVIINNIWYEET